MFRYQAFGLNFSSDVALPECKVSVSSSDDFRILSTTLSPPVFEPTNIFRRGIMAQTAVGSDGSLWLHWEGVATYRASGGNRLELQSFTTEGDVISLFTVSEALGLILFQRNHFLLHASAVQVGQTGRLFMGDPGAGKSTTCAAFVKAGCPLLSDDLTAIVFNEEGRPFICPAYPQLKIWEKSVIGLGYRKDDLNPVSEGVNKFSLQPQNNFPSEPVPLSHIYFIHHEEGEANLKQIKPVEFPLETLRHFPLPNQFLNPEVLQRYFRQSMMCAATTEAFVTKRPDGFKALESWVQACLQPEKSV